MRRLLFPLLAVLSGVVVALLVAEWAFSTFDLGPLSRAPAPMAVDPDLVFHQHDPDRAIGYTMRAGKEGSMQGLPTRINSHGCRGAEPAGDGPLVVALGDSITFGAGVHEAQAFPALVAGELSRLGTPVRLLGCGVSGYNLEQMMARYDRDLARLGPSLVLLNLFVDDLSPAYVLQDRSFASWLRFRSAVFRALERSKLWPGTGNRPVPAWARDHREYVTTMQERTAAFLRRHSDSGTAFLTITHPLLGKPLQGTAGPLEQLAMLAAKEGVPSVRMRPVYAEATGDDILSLSINPGGKDPHPNARGHALIARHVVDAIETHDLLDPTRKPPAPIPSAPPSVPSDEPSEPPTPVPLYPASALPGRICAVLDDGAASAGVRYWLKRADSEAEWVLAPADADPLHGAMECVDAGAGGLLVAIDPVATERVLRGPAFDIIAVAVPLPGPPPRGEWGPNSLAGGAPIEGVGVAIGEDGTGLRSVAVLHVPGPMGETIAAEIRERLDATVVAIPVERDQPDAWRQAAIDTDAQGLVVVGPPPVGQAVATTLGDRPRQRVWFSEWSTHPDVLDDVVAAGAIEEARWVNRLSPAGEFWQPARQTEGDINADLFSAGASAALLLDHAVGAGGGELADILDRARSLSGEGTPYGAASTTRSGGVLHLSGARYGIIRGVEGVAGGWAFSKVAPAGQEDR